MSDKPIGATFEWNHLSFLSEPLLGLFGHSDFAGLSKVIYGSLLRIKNTDLEESNFQTLLWHKLVNMIDECPQGVPLTVGQQQLSLEIRQQ